MVELPRRFIALRHRFEISRVFLDRDLGIAVEVGGDRGELLGERCLLLLRVHQVSARRGASRNWRSSRRNRTSPAATCRFSVTSTSLTMPETSVEMPTLSAST